MICFPLDNTPCEAKDMGAYLATRTRGVFSADGNLAVTPGASGLSVSVSPGLAWLKWADFWGTAAVQEQALTLTLDTADGVLKRIDAIVCRLDKVNNRAEIVVKKGAFSSAPIIAAPVRDANYDEIYLATVLIGAGITSITAGAITDQRLNETYCGLMRDGVTGIPTAMLQAQVQELIDHLRAEVEGIEQGSEVMLHTIYDPQGRNTDIFAAIPNPNLLDNSDFKNPVNQRGQANYADTGYCIDRWVFTPMRGATVTPTAEGLTITAPGGTLTQKLDRAAGASVTCSVGVSSGSATGNYDEAVRTFTITITGTTTITWAKLEKGSAATPYVPKGYGAELAECRRYYYSFQFHYSAIHVQAAPYPTVVPVQFPVMMRISPTITFAKQWDSGVTSISSEYVSTGGCGISINAASGALMDVHYTVNASADL